MGPINVHIDLSDGLELNRWQAITWTNDDQIHWCIYTSPGLNELSILFLISYAYQTVTK